MAYIFELFLWNAVGLLSFFLLVALKRLPRSWKQLKREMSRQYHMYCSIFDGFYVMKMDKVELVSHAGRVAVITGGNRGIGAKVVEKLIKCKISVIMGVRNPDEARRIMSRQIDLSNSTNVRIDYLQLDTGNLESVRHFARAVQKKHSKIDILINNAGIMAVPFHLNEDGFESHFAVNYLGHFLLTHLLMPQLRAAGKKRRNARIINVSSYAHLIGDIDVNDINGTNNYCPIKAYSQSKLALVLFTRELQRMFNKAKDCHVQVNSVHPGVVNTDHHSNFNISYFQTLRNLVFKTPEEGSRTIVYAAIAPKIEKFGGTYLSHCVQYNENPLVEDKDLLEFFFDYTCTLLHITDFGQIHKK